MLRFVGRVLIIWDREQTFFFAARMYADQTVIVSYL